jgi:hypothetical protein
MPRAVGLSRREFLRGAVAAAAAPYVITSAALGAGDRPSPSNCITLGFIGTGGRGIGRDERGHQASRDGLDMVRHPTASGAFSGNFASVPQTPCFPEPCGTPPEPVESKCMRVSASALRLGHAAGSFWEARP